MTTRPQTAKVPHVRLQKIVHIGRPMKFATRVGAYRRDAGDVQIQFTDDSDHIHGEFWGDNIFAPSYPEGTMGAVKQGDDWYWVIRRLPVPRRKKGK